jgi:hypothetical protein
MHDKLTISEHKLKEYRRVEISRQKYALEVLESAGVLTPEHVAEIRSAIESDEDEVVRERERQAQREKIDKLLRRLSGLARESKHRDHKRSMKAMDAMIETVKELGRQPKDVLDAHEGVQALWRRLEESGVLED